MALMLQRRKGCFTPHLKRPLHTARTTAGILSPSNGRQKHVISYLARRFRITQISYNADFV
jgi:hypothetical protein